MIQHRHVEVSLIRVFQLPYVNDYNDNGKVHKEPILFLAAVQILQLLRLQLLLRFPSQEEATVLKQLLRVSVMQLLHQLMETLQCSSRLQSVQL